MGKEEKDLIIRKETMIRTVKSEYSSNAPFRIELTGKEPNSNSKMTLTFDEKSLERFGFSLPLPTASEKRFVVCTLESKRISSTDSNLLLDDSLLRIERLKQDEEIEWIINYFGDEISARKVERTIRKIILRSSQLHGEIICPVFKIELELSRSEYLLCEKLPALTLMKVDFQLLETEKEE